MKPEPPTIGFDTSAAHCAAALIQGGEVLADRCETLRTGQAERLMPLLEEMLAEAGLGWAALGAIGVGVGPGNFTGVRISVAAARGLALALGIPAVGVSGFEAMAEGGAVPVLALIGGRRGTVFAQAVGWDEPARQVSVEALPGHWAGSGLACVGHEAAAFAALTEGRSAAPAMPAAVAIARIAARRAGDDPARPKPLYLRAVDAVPAKSAPVLLP